LVVLQPGFKTDFGRSYRAALIKINGSGNFHHINLTRDSEKRQRLAVSSFADRSSFEIAAVPR